MKKMFLFVSTEWQMFNEYKNQYGWTIGAW